MMVSNTSEFDLQASADGVTLKKERVTSAKNQLQSREKGDELRSGPIIDKNHHRFSSEEEKLKVIGEQR